MEQESYPATEDEVREEQYVLGYRHGARDKAQRRPRYYTACSDQADYITGYDTGYEECKL